MPRLPLYYYGSFDTELEYILHCEITCFGISLLVADVLLNDVDILEYRNLLIESSSELIKNNAQRVIDEYDKILCRHN